MSSIVTCDTCGCCVTPQMARERRWGTLRGRPQCSEACASRAFTREFVSAHWTGPYLGACDACGRAVTDPDQILCARCRPVAKGQP
jgi:hypothetical protein